MRMQRMRRQVMEHNVYRWAASILADLRDLRMEAAESADPSRAGPVVAPAEGEAERKLA
jgi:trehalose 6-phosphate synthase